MALDPDVAEPVRGEPRLEDVARHAGRDDAVDLPGAQRLGQERHRRPQVLHRDVAVGAERLAVGQGDLGALGAEVGEADAPVDVLAEVDDVDAGPEHRHRHRPDLLDGTDRRRRRGDQRVVPAVADDDRPPLDVGADEPPVLALPLDQVGGQDVRRRPLPSGIGGDNTGGAVLVLDVELGEERRLGAPLVGRSQDADLAAIPPVGEQRVEGVRAGTEEVGDVVRLHLGAVVVLREAGRQLVGADPDAVDLELVDAVGGGAQQCSAYGAVECELAAEPVRRARAGRSGVAGRGDPGGGPVSGGDHVASQRESGRERNAELPMPAIRVSGGRRRTPRAGRSTRRRARRRGPRAGG